jgi:hypothetical protein
MYDPTIVETVTGVVTTADTVTGRRNRQHQVIHVRRTANSETLSVHRGSRVTMRGEPSMIAAELTRQDQT